MLWVSAPSNVSRSFQSTSQKKNTGKLSCRIRKLRWRKQKKKFVCCFLSNYPCQFAKLYHRKLFQLRSEHKSISQRSNWKQCNWRRKKIRLNCKNCASHRWHNRKKKHHRRNRKKPGWVRACTSEPSSWYSYNWIFGFSSCARENFFFSERRFVIRLWAGVLSSPKNLHRLKVLASTKSCLLIAEWFRTRVKYDLPAPAYAKAIAEGNKVINITISLNIK